MHWTGFVCLYAYTMYEARETQHQPPWEGVLCAQMCTQHRVHRPCDTTAVRPDPRTWFCLQDPEILCWDLRQADRVLFSLQRNVDTNQCVYFDMDQYDLTHVFTQSVYGKQ